MNYKENTFYHCLNLLDSYLVYILKKEISKKVIFLIVLGFYCFSNWNLKYGNKMFANNNYNVINYSAYGWVKIFNRIGIIFNTNTYNVN